MNREPWVKGVGFINSLCKHNIVLTGFMGTGKTSVGRGLAAEFGLEFLDTDDLIEKDARMSINEIFVEFGEAHFRKLEKEVIKRVTSTMDGLVLSTGGGAVIDDTNRERLKSWGKVICLSASAKTILDRVRGQDERPLLSIGNKMQSIERLLEDREPFYKESDLIIDTTTKGVDEVVAEIKDFLLKDKRL
jgi:shikimate kinase